MSSPVPGPAALTSEIPGPFIWSFMERHLDEAAFLFGMRRRFLASRQHTLAELEGLVDARLEAHLDGLALGGKPVMDTLLLPALGSDDEEAVTAAAAALARGARPEGHAQVVTALDGAPPGSPRHQALGSALPWAGAAFEETARQAVASGLAPATRAQVLQALAVTGRLQDPDVHAALASREPALMAVGLDLLRGPAAPAVAAFVAECAHTTAPSLRLAAARAARRLALPFARPAALALAEDAALPDAAPLLLAAGAEPADVEALLGWLTPSGPTSQGIQALGLAGTRAALQACLAFVGTAGDLGNAAALAFCASTGAPVPAPPPDEDDTEAPDIHQGAAAARARPEDGLRAFWADHGHTFSDGVRYLEGKPLTSHTLIAALEHGPLDWRPLLAWELEVRSAGWLRVAADAPARLQRAALAHARATVTS